MGDRLARVARAVPVRLFSPVADHVIRLGHMRAAGPELELAAQRHDLVQRIVDDAADETADRITFANGGGGEVDLAASDLLEHVVDGGIDAFEIGRAHV